MENTVTLADSVQKLTLTGDEAVIAIDGRNIKIPLASLKQYFDIQSFGAVIPVKAPGLNLGAPADPKVYYAGAGEYILNGVVTVLPEALNILFWNKQNWEVLDVILPEAENKIQSWVAGPYITGDQRVHRGVTWQALANTSAEPSSGSVSDWVALGAVGGRFPYQRYSVKNQSDPMQLAVLDMIIENAKPSKFYMLTNIVIASNAYIIRVHEADNNNSVSGAFAIINHTFTDTDNGVQLISNVSGGTEVSLLVDVDYMKTLPVGTIGNNLAVNYPLSDSIFKGYGKGLIKAVKDSDSISNIKTRIDFNFPYQPVIGQNKRTLDVFSAAVTDMVVLNPKIDKFYSLSNIVVADDRETFTIRAHESDTNQGGGSFAVINKSFSSDLKGVQLFEGMHLGTNIKILVDVDYIKQLEAGTYGTNWPFNFPLNPSILEGYGRGLIEKKYKYFPYKEYSDKTVADTFSRAVKDIVIVRPDPSKFYSLTNIVIAPNSYIIRVHEAPTHSGSSGALTLINKQFTDADSGIQFLEGSRSGATARMLVDVDFLKTLPVGTLGPNWSLYYPLADDVFSGVGNPEVNSVGYKEKRTIPLTPQKYAYVEDVDSCEIKDFDAVSRINQGFMQLEVDSPNARANSRGEITIDKDGIIDLKALVFSDPSKPPSADGINSYLTDVNFPSLTNVKAMEDRWTLYPYREPVALDLIHPEIIDTGIDKIGGYRYWLCASNHPAYAGSIEDETLFVSNDLKEWKRIKSATEAFNSKIHAVGIVLPPHNLVTPDVVTYDMFLPVPQSGVVVVDGVSKTVAGWLKHDPCMVYDSEERAIYFILTYHLSFTDDGGIRPADANQWSVCIRTLDGIVWDVVRQDGTFFPLAAPADSRLIFTQTGGKGNYLRHRYRPVPSMLGNSICKHDGLWWWFYGVNGDRIYRGNKVYNVNFDSFLPSTRDTFNHPGHFSHGGEIYRWGRAGLSKMNADYTFTLFPINATFRGFRGEGPQYKKSMFVSADGTATWVVADRRDEFRTKDFTSSFIPSKTTPITIGQCDISKMILASTVSKRGFYFSIEIFHQTIERVFLYRSPFAVNSSASDYSLVTLAENISVKKGDTIVIDASVISFGDVKVAISELALSYK